MRPHEQVIHAIRSHDPHIEALIDRLSLQSLRHVSSHTGDTLMHWAAHYGNLLAIRALMRADVPRHRRNDAGQTPSDLAKRAGHEGVCQLLTRGALSSPARPMPSRSGTYTEVTEIIETTTITYYPRVTAPCVRFERPPAHPAASAASSESPPSYEESARTALVRRP